MSTIEALELVIDRSEGGGRASKELMKKTLRKAYREGNMRAWVDNPDWQFKLCCANLVLGNYSWAGWEFRCIAQEPWSQMLWLNQKAFGKPRWERQSGRVLMLGEQGLGDEIMFASCIPEVQKTNEVGITCLPRLKSIFERSFQCEVYDRHEGKELSRARELLSGYDYYIGIGDLPRLLRRSRASFPGTAYLVPDPRRLEEMSRYSGLTGISWRGRNGFYQMSEFPKGISLQYDLAWDEEPEVPHIDLRDDLEGLLALVSVLGKVVSVPTTVAHFSGAAGVKTEVIIAPVQTARSKNQLNFRWPRMEISPWYSSASIYQNMKQWEKSHRVR